MYHKELFFRGGDFQQNKNAPNIMRFLSKKICQKLKKHILTFLQKSIIIRYINKEFYIFYDANQKVIQIYSNYFTIKSHFLKIKSEGGMNK